MRIALALAVVALVGTGAYAKGPAHTATHSPASKSGSVTLPPCSACGFGHYKANLVYFFQTYLPLAEQCDCIPPNPSWASVPPTAPKKTVSPSSPVLNVSKCQFDRLCR